VTARSGHRPDPIEEEIEKALRPGRFIDYSADRLFIDGLQEVEAKIAKRVRWTPSRAVALYEAFLAGCYAKANEIDGSSGRFGMFVDNLFRGWIKARQAARADRDETASRLLAWMTDDPWGFCHELEDCAVSVLDRSGLAAFERRVRARFDAALRPTPGQEAPLSRKPEYERRRWGETLRAIHVAQKNVAGYVALAEETGLTSKDCHAVATMLAARRKRAEAMTWVERGIQLQKKAPDDSTAGDDLAKLKRELLVGLGRGAEALDAAWAEYRANPCTDFYEELMKFVPKRDRSAWHAKAINTAMGGHLESLLQLLLETNETDRLVSRLRETPDDALEDISHSITEPAATRVQERHPDLAARLWRAQGMRIVNAKKSKYYDVAFQDFENAKRCYERAGLFSEWLRVVEEVRVEHYRKGGFMPGFEDVVAGRGPSTQPTFLEEAKARWSGHAGEGE
jgi:hypothetical protein